MDLHNIFDLPLSITIGQLRLMDADFYIFKLNPYPLTYHRGMIDRVPLPFESGIFFLWGEEGEPYTQIYRFGFDWRGEFGSFYPFAQVMIGWDGKFLGIDKIYGWAKIILGVDYTS